VLLHCLAGWMPAGAGASPAEWDMNVVSPGCVVTLAAMFTRPQLLTHHSIAATTHSLTHRHPSRFIAPPPPPPPPPLPLQMDPPPRFVVSPEMVDMMRREGIAGLFTPDVLLRWGVGPAEHEQRAAWVAVAPVWCLYGW
jgi:hypothetical protein